MVGSLPIVVSCQATNPTARSTHTSVVERLGDRTGLLGFRAVTTRSIFLSPPVEEGVSEDFRGLGGSGPDLSTEMCLGCSQAVAASRLPGGWVFGGTAIVENCTRCGAPVEEER